MYVPLPPVNASFMQTNMGGRVLIDVIEKYYILSNFNVFLYSELCSITLIKHPVVYKIL